MNQSIPTLQTPLLYNPRKDKDRERILRKIVLMGTVIILLLLISAVTTLLIVLGAGTDGLLDDYKINSQHLGRPNYYVQALNESKITQQSGGSSTILPDGSVMWMFGETTIINSDSTIISLPNSALVIQNQGSEASFIKDENGVPRTVIHIPSSSEMYTGGTAVVRDRVYVHWMTIKKSGIQACGQIDKRFVDIQNFTASFNTPYLEESTCETFIAHSIIHEDYLYHFVVQDGNVLLGRAMMGSIQGSDLPTEFWDGKEFGNNPVSILPGWNPTTMSVAWNEYLQAFVLITATNDRIQLIASPHLEGPWCDPTFIYLVPSDHVTEEGILNIHFHPEMWTGDGRNMVFSYSAGQGDGFPYFVETQLTHQHRLRLA